MLPRLIIYLPFFYFQQSRLKHKKDYIFHGVYEWIPVLIILSWSWPLAEATLFFGIYYLAFIALYEIGYLINDQLAHDEKEGRIRASKFSVLEIVCFITIRIGVFATITL